MSYSFSRTWVSDEMKERDKFFDTLENLERMTLVPRSPFLPTTLAEWYAHRLGLKEAEIKEENRKMALRITADAAKKKITDPNGRCIKPAFGDKAFGDNRSAVLAFESIWCLWSTATTEKPQAPWPTRNEMEFEGDERVTSGYNRFPPLPRVPGNETVNWKCKANIRAHGFDQVWTLSTAQSTDAVLDDEQKLEMLELIGSELLIEIDA